MKIVSKAVAALALFAAVGAQAGVTSGVQKQLPIVIDVDSIECKLTKVHSGYGDIEREVLTFSLGDKQTLGLLDVTAFTTHWTGNYKYLCAQVPALKAALLASQGKIVADVETYAELYGHAPAGQSVLSEWITFTLELPNGVGVQVAGNKQINVVKK